MAAADDTAWFDLLPDEILIEMFKHLGNADLFKASFVCRRFLAICASLAHRRPVTQQDFPSHDVFIGYLQRFGGCFSLRVAIGNLMGVPFIPNDEQGLTSLEEALSGCHVKHLDVEWRVAGELATRKFMHTAMCHVVGLETITVHHETFDEFHDYDQFGASAIERNSSTLTRIAIIYGSRNSLYDSFTGAIATASGLTHLRVPVLNLGLLRHLPCLIELTLDVNSEINPGDVDPLNGQPPAPQVARLHLRGNECSVDDRADLILPLCGSIFVGVKDFQIQGSCWTASRVNSLLQKMSSLAGLGVDCGYSESLEYLLQLRPPSGVTELKLAGMLRVHDRSGAYSALNRAHPNADVSKVMIFVASQLHDLQW